MTTATTDDAATLPSRELSAEQLQKMLYDMMLIRRFEERTMQAYMQRNIGGFCHIYIGQEACAVGSINAVKPDDPVVTAYRDHGHALARGMDPRYCMAEMFGKITGCAKGKGGSMHMFDKQHFMFGGHAIVGGQCPLGVGLAFATKYLDENKVTLCYLGDGALNQGAVHESMNLAAIWKLPIIFILENNMYSMGTHIARGTASADNLKAKADAYAMNYGECDGMGALKVYDCVKPLADAARAGEGPAFVNVQTYRYKGHSMSDPQKYRTKEEVSEYEDTDCIARLIRRLTDAGKMTSEKAQELDDQAKQIAQESIKYADECSDPPVDELWTDVYVNPFGRYEKGKLSVMFEGTGVAYGS